MLTAAEAWSWAAHLFSREADAIDYAWPRLANAYELSAPLHDEANACHERAARLDPSDDLWRRAIAKWEGA